MSQKIPYSVEREFDEMDTGDKGASPMFTCESCVGQMYIECYKGTHGIEYRLSDMK